MPDCMMPFPEDWHDFLKDYSFDDSQEVYTNGSRLIPVFRVEQLIEHLLKAHEPVKPTLDIRHGKSMWRCGSCSTALQPNNMNAKFCFNCGQAVKWK